jgi:hypothetical protein
MKRQFWIWIQGPVTGEYGQVPVGSEKLVN